jgi:tRNA-splicing ligase RtcB
VAEGQLGTIGSGNHYVGLFTDEEDHVSIYVHFGSRGFGHGVVTWFLKAAGAKDGREVEPCVLSASSDHRGVSRAFGNEGLQIGITGTQKNVAAWGKLTIFKAQERPFRYGPGASCAPGGTRSRTAWSTRQSRSLQFLSVS